ncbi:MAG: ATP-dependent Clp protease adapter ClpS [SAR324 cluster bacterium]|nr:ATP-dependent Clp protease adapter ClpS [SAR324 cluster bacterium]MED5515998.1 ATP-dependent Clp protease adapter ClpS [SAR324 cluster bacterium]MED6339350.1 ATP-dependent Clp protease adapter ClpS [SAR324 cluster bacterium]MEE2599135.1 ATP-dependent Clp protease adapter ClpS [SAR324 cluster bacterium]
MSEIEYDEQLATKTRHKIRPPQSYKVLLHNDNYTTMEFVVFVLESVFKKSLEEATQIMFHVHENGVGVCGSYSFEVAETKVESVHGLAKEYEYPLQATMEEN